MSPTLKAIFFVTVLLLFPRYHGKLTRVSAITIKNGTSAHHCMNLLLRNVTHKKCLLVIIDDRQDNWCVEKLLTNLSVPTVILDAINFGKQIVLEECSQPPILLIKNGAPVIYSKKLSHTELVDASEAEQNKSQHSPVNLQGRLLRVGVINYPPFMVFPANRVVPGRDLQLSSPDLEQLLDGVELRMLRHLANKFNFSMSLLLRQETDLWGTVYTNGTATGLVGMVRDGHLDVATGGFNWDVRYWGHVHLAYPHRKSLVKFLTLLPETRPNWLALLQPFRADAWCGIVAVQVVAGALVLYVVQRWQPRHRFGPPDVVLCVLVALSALTQQGDVPRQWCRGLRRPLLLGLQGAAVLLGACYCGLLVAVLTLEPQPVTLDTPQELAEAGLEYIEVDDIFPGQLELSDDSHIQMLVSRLKLVSSWSELNHRLRGGGATFTVECLDTDFLCLQEPLEPDLLRKLYLPRDHILISETALLLSLKLPLALRRAWDLETLRLVQSGVLQVWERRVQESLEFLKGGLQQGGSLQQQPRQGPVVLTTAHLGGPFFLLTIGLALAFVIFLFETCIYR